MTKSFSPDIFRNFDELLGKYWLGRWQTIAEICQNEKKEPEKNRTSKKQNQQKREPAKNRNNEKPEPVKNRSSKQTRTSKITEPEKTAPSQTEPEKTEPSKKECK